MDELGVSSVAQLTGKLNQARHLIRVGAHLETRSVAKRERADVVGGTRARAAERSSWERAPVASNGLMPYSLLCNSLAPASLVVEERNTGLVLCSGVE